MVDDLKAFIDLVQPRHGAYRDLGDGRYGVAVPLMFHWTLITGAIGDEYGYDDRWCYADQASAEAALVAWNRLQATEPSGWYRHPASGRRRLGGDATKEWIAP